MTGTDGHTGWFWWTMGIVGAVVSSLIVAAILGGFPPSKEGASELTSLPSLSDDLTTTIAEVVAAGNVVMSIAGPSQWSVADGPLTLTGSVAGAVQSAYWIDGYRKQSPWNNGQLILACFEPGTFVISLVVVDDDGAEHQERHSLMCTL